MDDSIHRVDSFRWTARADSNGGSCCFSFFRCKKCHYFAFKSFYGNHFQHLRCSVRVSHSESVSQHHALLVSRGTLLSLAQVRWSLSGEKLSTISSIHDYSQVLLLAPVGRRCMCWTQSPRVQQLACATLGGDLRDDEHDGTDNIISVKAEDFEADRWACETRRWED